MAQPGPSSSEVSVQHLDGSAVSGYSRKRPAKMNDWQKNECKLKRNSGSAYISRNNKRHVVARKIGPPCKCGCFEKIGAELVTNIFDSFWQIGNYDLQNAYLSKLLICNDVKRSYVKGRPSRTLRRIQYNVTVDHANREVCRTAFYNIHGISEKRVRVVLDKTSRTGTVTTDQRGRCEPAKKIGNDDLSKVKEHIMSLPTVTSHYSRAKSPHRKYLPVGLNIKKLYSLYNEWLTENYPGYSPVNQHYYRDTFNMQFNIGFEPPKSDTCNYCDKVDIKIKSSQMHDSENVAEIENLKQEKELHLTRAKAAQSLLKGLRSNADDSFLVIAFDLQQALPTPKLTTGIQYYKRKLWTYNFCIHNVKTGSSTMYLWDESTGRRGSCEIASCLYDYLCKVDVNVKKVIMFSDNCSGQNKNLNLVLANLYFIHKDQFTEIKHYFMIPGHSYLPCDRDFGNIEREIRNSTVYTMDHYKLMIESCRRKNQFCVVQLRQDMIFNFSNFQKKITKMQMAGAKFKDGKIFEFTNNFKQGFYIHSAYNLDVKTAVKLQKGKVKNYDPDHFHLASETLTRLYSAPIKIPAPKLKDIQDLLPYVPLPWSRYFTNIIASQDAATNKSTENEDVMDDDQIDYN